MVILIFSLNSFISLRPIYLLGITPIACRANSGYDWVMDDNTYECPQCGSAVYPEMTRCPVCGHNMYPEDDQSFPEAAEADVSNLGSSIGTILVGLLITAAIALVFHFVVASFSTPANLGMGGVILLYLAGPLGALAGGYVSGGIKTDHSMLFGGIIGLLSLPVLLLYATHWVEVSSGFLISIFVWLSGLATILAGAFGGWLHIKLTTDGTWKENSGNISMELIESNESYVINRLDYGD